MMKQVRIDSNFSPQDKSIIDSLINSTWPSIPFNLNRNFIFLLLQIFEKRKTISCKNYGITTHRGYSFSFVFSSK